MLCTSIYFFSNHNRKIQFQNRLFQKAINTGDQLQEMDPKLVRDINEVSGGLYQKSVFVYDSSFHEIFAYHDNQEEAFSLDVSVLSVSNPNKPFYFKIGEKDAVVTLFDQSNFKYYIVVAAFDQDRADWLPQLRIVMFLCFIISVSIVIVSGYIFSLRLVAEISDLTQKVNSISANEFSRRLNAGSGKDEFQQLAITINNLLDRLKTAFDTERRFIDNASHELATPLASIGSQIDVVLQRERNAGEYKNVFRSILEDVRRLSVLVRSLLEIAKLSGSAKAVESTPVRIDEMLMRLPSEIKRINEDFEIKLLFGELPEDDDALTVMGNEELLFSAFKNIAHNACKFSADKTAIVTLSYENNHVKICIKDNGPGIGEEEQERIFQPFYRSAATSSKVSGSGLGLSLAYQIIRLYGGTIALESEPGKGSMFTIDMKSLDGTNLNAATAS